MAKPDQDIGPSSDQAAEQIVRTSSEETYTYRGTTYGVHPLARVFPLITGERFAELEEHARANGIRDPIALYRGDIVDGRNRMRVAAKLDIDVEFVELSTSDDLYQFVLGRNLRRREMTPSIRAMTAANLRAVSQLLARTPAPSGYGQTTPVVREGEAAGGGTETPEPEIVTRPSAAAVGAAAPKPRPRQDAGAERPAFEPGPSRATYVPKSDRETGGEGTTVEEVVSRKAGGTMAKPLTIGQAAKILGASERSVKRAERVRAADSDLAEAVSSGLVPLSQAESPEVLDADPDVRRAAIEDVKSGAPGTLPAAVARQEEERGIEPRRRRKPSTPGRRSSGLIDEDIELSSLPTVPGLPGAAPASADAVPACDVFSPEVLIRTVRLAMGGIDLDPASSEKAQIAVQATHWFGSAEDGLSQVWRGRVYCFPPPNAVSAYADKLWTSIVAETVPQAAFFAAAVAREPWVVKLMSMKEFSHLVYVDVGNGLSIEESSPLSISSLWRPSMGMTLYCFGYEGPECLKYLSDLGPVLVPAVP